MRVLIANANKDIVLKISPKIKFTSYSKNTSTFNIGLKSFDALVLKCEELGYNRYALFSW